MPRLIVQMPPLIEAVIIIALAILAAAAVHFVVFCVLLSLSKRRNWQINPRIIRGFSQPARLLAMLFALTVVQPLFPLDKSGLEAWRFFEGLAMPALIGWLALSAVGALAEVLTSNADISAADNLQARRRRTRLSILKRIAAAAIIFTTVGWMLMAIPSIRNIGVTLMASAGLAALAVGAAAQPVLKNLMAGVQMAFSEPISIDDVVVLGDEWGRVEEIKLTYVVLKLWDERRLVVPVSKFLEDTFQNWTRATSQITGSIKWHLDPSTEVERLRAKLKEIVEGDPRWDGRFYNMQVTETNPKSIEVRALVTAKNASDSFDLRCSVREEILAFVRAEMPEAIVRHRTELLASSYAESTHKSSSQLTSNRLARLRQGADSSAAQ